MSTILSNTPQVFFVEASVMEQTFDFNFDFTFSDIISAVNAKTPVFLIVTFTDYPSFLQIPADKMIFNLSIVTDNGCLFMSIDGIGLQLSPSSELSTVQVS